MRQLPPIVLDATQVAALEHAAARPPVTRRRAQAVLSQHRGLSLQQVTAAYAVGRDTVREWLTRSEQGSVVGLTEGPRRGRPLKLDAAAKKNPDQGGPAASICGGWYRAACPS